MQCGAPGWLPGQGQGVGGKAGVWQGWNRSLVTRTVMCARLSAGDYPSPRFREALAEPSGNDALSLQPFCKTKIVSLKLQKKKTPQMVSSEM